MPDYPKAQYGLEIQVISTKEGGAMPPSTHGWQVPVVEDMLCGGKSGLTEVIVEDPG